MAGIAKVGSRCQAIDEEGRWENAKVTSVNEDGHFVVAFPGWGPAFDRLVRPEETRASIPPVDQQSRSKYTEVLRGLP